MVHHKLAPPVLVLVSWLTAFQSPWTKRLMPEPLSLAKPLCLPPVPCKFVYRRSGTIERSDLTPRPWTCSAERSYICELARRVSLCHYIINMEMRVCALMGSALCRCGSVGNCLETVSDKWDYTPISYTATLARVSLCHLYGVALVVSSHWECCPGTEPSMLSLKFRGSDQEFG